MSLAWYCLQLEARLVLAAVFALSAAAKLRSATAVADFRRAAAALGGPRLPSDAPAVLAVVVPAGEAALAAALLLTASAAAALACAAVLLTGFAAVLTAALRRGESASCNCFGSSRHPVSRAQVVRNAVLTAVALLGLTGAVMRHGVQSIGLPALLVAVVAAGAAVWVVALWDDLAALFLPVRR